MAPGWDGLLAAGALLLLLVVPGVLVVRAPWPVVPLLSAAFWIGSWWWADLLGRPRSRFLGGALIAFAPLLFARAVRFRPWARPSWPALVVAAGALLRAVPLLLWPVAPGADMSLHALSARLLVQKDGIPATYEPLLPIPTFGAYTPGLHALAADVALLSGASADRAAFLVAVAAHGLLQLALFELLRRLVAERAAAVAALLALGLARVPQGFFGWGANPSVLALALLVGGGALVGLARGRAAAVAGGLMLGAAVVAHSMMVAAAVCCAPLAAVLVHEARDRRFALQRLAWGAGVAFLVCAPFLWQLDFTTSPAERAWMADNLQTHYAQDWRRYSETYAVAVLRYVVATLNDAFLAVCLAGLAWWGWRAGARERRVLFALGLSALAIVGIVATTRGGGMGPILFFPERPVAVLAMLLAPGLAWLVERLLAASRRRALAAAVLAALALTAAERAHRYYFRDEYVLVSADDLEAMRWLRDHTGPLDTVCNDYGTAALWIPALAGRAISEPHLPPFYFDEFRRSARPCALRYATSRWFFGPPLRPLGAGQVLFANATVRLVREPGGAVTLFDSATRNLPPNSFRSSE